MATAKRRQEERADRSVPDQSCNLYSDDENNYDDDDDDNDEYNNATDDIDDNEYAAFNNNDKDNNLPAADDVRNIYQQQLRHQSPFLYPVPLIGRRDVPFIGRNIGLPVTGVTDHPAANNSYFIHTAH